MTFGREEGLKLPELIEPCRVIRLEVEANVTEPPQTLCREHLVGVQKIAGVLPIWLVVNFQSNQEGHRNRRTAPYSASIRRIARPR